MAYTNSSLVTYTNLSPNHGGLRGHSIDRITPHCIVGQWTAKKGCDFFANESPWSCNYVCGIDGADLNNYHTSGFYYIRTGVTNAPTSWCWCIICDGAGTMQMCITTTNIFVRCYTGNPLAWTRWRSVALS